MKEKYVTKEELEQVQQRIDLAMTTIGKMITRISKAEERLNKIEFELIPYERIK